MERNTLALGARSPALGEADLLSLPFDQYGRMRIAQNVLNALYTEIAPRQGGPGAPGYKLRVLDVGGYPGVLRHFLSPDYFELTVLDVVPDDGTIPGYVQGSGLDLPYEDDSFDIVTSLDTLEHIPADRRDRFLAETMRAARHAVVLINPIQSTEADLAEETLNEYIWWVLDARHEQLAEHREYGLPNFALTGAAFEQAGWLVTRFTTANVYNWLLMMVAKHYLISLRDERASEFERTLDRFYNLTFSDSDHVPPPYRGVVVAVRPGLEAALKRIQESYPPVLAEGTTDTANILRLQLAQILMTMLDIKTANHEDRKLREQIERRDRHIQGLETRLDLQQAELERMRAEMDLQRAEMLRKDEYVRRLEQDIRHKDEHILYLEKLLQDIEAGRVMRLTRAISRFLGRH